MNFLKKDEREDLEVGFLLQGIFPTQESNLGLLHCRQILYRLTTMEAPICSAILYNVYAYFAAIKFWAKIIETFEIEDVSPI